MCLLGFQSRGVERNMQQPGVYVTPRSCNTIQCFLLGWPHQRECAALFLLRNMRSVVFLLVFDVLRSRREGLLRVSETAHITCIFHMLCSRSGLTNTTIACIALVSQCLLQDSHLFLSKHVRAVVLMVQKNTHTDTCAQRHARAQTQNCIMGVHTHDGQLHS